MFALLLIAASILPTPPDVLRDTCDLVELNHFYDEHGRLVFDQIIFWDWSDRDARYQVRSWRLVKTPDILPERDFARGGYACIWVDGEVTRSVRSAGYRETWTQVDPELAEREILPKEKRRELSAVR
jgi:hypothetical protein